MRKKRILLVLLALFLVLPSFLVHAAAKDSVTEAAGNMASKDEVVYARLSATGVQEEIYVVNIFDVIKPGKLVDHGKYTSVKNLTDLSEMEQFGETVEFPASEGKFYYQGNMENDPLPWDINISYFLDGEGIDPEKLAGKDGHVRVHIETAANDKVNPVFFENYVVQISLSLDSERFQNIEAGEGSVANAGKNKLVTFTVMPEKEVELSLEADVVNFELDGIEIAAAPFSMSIDAPDTDEMAGEMESLTEAIEQLHNGVGELRSGISQLNDGAASLRDGSGAYKNGMAELSAGSGELVAASRSIDEALATISSSLRDNTEQLDFLGDLQELPLDFAEVASSLRELADGLAYLRENYSGAYRNLEEAMKDIPEYTITEEDIENLYNSGADKRVVDQLLETYKAAQAARIAFSDLREALDAVDSRLQEMGASIEEVQKTLVKIADGLGALEGMEGAIAKLLEGMETMSSEYGKFHSGLVSYTRGVDQLSNSYNGFHSGIVALSDGTEKLEDGADELHDGTGKLYAATSGLPDQMQEEIDEMIAQYDKSDFKAVSFVSAANEKMNSVQFVIRTDSIKKKEQAKIEESEEEPKGFWTRLKDLFGF